MERTNSCPAELSEPEGTKRGGEEGRETVKRKKK